MPPPAFGSSRSRPDYPDSSAEDSDTSARRSRRKSKTRRGSSSRAPSPAVLITYDKEGNRLQDAGEGNESSEAPPEVLWRLAVHRRKRDDGSNTKRDHRVTYVGQRPFDIKLCTDEDVGLTSVRRSGTTYELQQQPMFEVVTKVLDSRFTLKDSNRDVDVRDLKISQVYGEEMNIRSEHIRHALAEMVTYYPAFPPHQFERTLHLQEPYAMLMHHFPDIDALATAGFQESGCDAHENEEHRARLRHVTVLRDFLKVQYEAQVLPCIKKLSQPTPRIRYDMLWYLFRPGDTVYVQGVEDVYACVVQSVTHSSHRCALAMWCMDTDGKRLGRKAREYTIYRYAGVQKVVALPVCPVAIWDAHDGGVQRAHILRRSELYLGGLRAGRLYAQYKGKGVGGPDTKLTWLAGANEITVLR